MSLALSIISFTKKGSSLTGIGATTGLFIAWPYMRWYIFNIIYQ